MTLKATGFIFEVMKMFKIDCDDDCTHLRIH